MPYDEIIREAFGKKGNLSPKRGEQASHSSCPGAQKHTLHLPSGR